MDFQPIIDAPLQIKLHLAAALAALVVGSTILVGAKGTAAHRALGWTYVLLMTVTALSAIFIRRADGGIPNFMGFTPIHLFIVLTAIGLPRALFAIRRGDVRRHARSMTSLFVGALIIAGVFAFLPGRILNAVAFG